MLAYVWGGASMVCMGKLRYLLDNWGLRDKP
jgi:hypothetical protein